MVWSHSLFRDTAVPLLILAPTGRISSANPAALAFFGRRSLSGGLLTDLVAPDDRRLLDAYLTQLTALRVGYSEALGPIRLRCGDGYRLAPLVGSRGEGETGAPVLLISPGVMPSDISVGMPAPERLDPLTGVAARGHGLEALAREVHPDATGCLLLVDLDELEDFNLTFGVAEGDLVLAEVAGRLRRTVPAGATVARIDGDAFLVVSPLTPIARVKDLGRALLAAIAAPMDIAGTRIVTASIGAAGLSGQGADEALGRAGRALEAAKAKGGRQVVVDGPTSATYGRRRSDLIASMRVMESSIDSLRSDAERAHSEARTDTLTGLPNERRYAEDVRMLQDRIGRVAGSTAALFVDLDRFGLINKAFGQERGDATLARVAGVLAAQCRSGDTVYRVGGEEFVVLMPGTDQAGGCVAAERIRAAVEAAAIPHQGRTGFQIVTVSVGVAAGSGPSVDVAGVVNRANGQMRRAKRAGRNRVSPRPDPHEGVA